jgi:hypothetical protein
MTPLSNSLPIYSIVYRYGFDYVQKKVCRNDIKYCNRKSRPRTLVPTELNY